MDAGSDTDGTDDFEFGQSERLTRRLAGLIRGYPPGLGILKEFLQNADDAGARALHVVLDLRIHPAEQLPDVRMHTLCGPALLLANDARFTPEDLLAIRRISESSKTDSGPKTGRFGLGFNTAYNLTDHPAFVTNDGIYCFDPHRDAVARGEEHGRRWQLATMWRESPGWPRLFCAGGLVDGCEDHPGTIFRLPLRPAGRLSEICEVTFTAAEARAIFVEAAEVGSGLLIFTRNLELLTIAEIDDAGRRELLRVEAAPEAEFRVARAALNEALQGDLGARIAEWRVGGRPLPCSVCSSTWRVTTPDAVREERWRMCIGLTRGVDDRLLQAATEMLNLREKAVPWFGVAARLDGGRARPVAGRLYCGPPLPVESAQPVHNNGYFDLDATRQHLTSPRDAAGSGVLARVRWNAALLEEGVAVGWARLLADMARQGVGNLYAVFPVMPANDGPIAGMVRRTYAELAGMPVVRTKAADGMRLVRPDALQLPARGARVELAEPLAAEGLPMPAPELPAAVEANFGVAIQALTPAGLRELLHSSTDVDCEISEAPRPCLRRRVWVERLLAYGTSDGSKALGGLPLLVTSDGRLRTIGSTRVVVADEEERAIFAEKRGWFVDPAFAAAARLGPVPEAKLIAMDPGLVLRNLPAVLGKQPARDWSPEGATAPNRAWLALVLRYLVHRGLDRASPDKLAELPILPGSDGRLYAPVYADAPLIVAKADSRPDLLVVLRGLGVTLLDEHATLSPALDELLQRVPDLGPRLTGPRLVDVLYARREQVDVLVAGARPLLEYLAESRWRYTPQQKQRLAALPLFPSDHGVTALEGERVFLPSHFKPPALALAVRLLQEERRWGQLYEQLGVTEIDAWGYLNKALLPALAELVPDDRHRALAWLRDNLLALTDQRGWNDTRLRLREIPLMLGTDGALHPITELHDPDNKLIREVLGPEAMHPDMGRYADRRPAWLAFFRAFGIVQELSKDRLVRHVQTLSVRGLVATPALARVFEYLDQSVEEETATAILAALRNYPWIPAKQSAKAPGFVPPEDRLYRPGELALSDRLVGSQLPVAAWRPTRAATVTALGMLRNPPALAVLEHLQHLCHLCTGPTPDDAAAKDLASNFRELYIYLDRFCGERRDGPRFTSQEAAHVADLADQACIWDPTTARLWVPTDVFTEPVPFFAPLRASVKPTNCERFLARLGCKQTPCSDDYASFLDDLRSLVGDASLSEPQRRQALHALLAIAPETEAPVPLLTTDDRLVDSSALYWNDAPWLTGRLGAGLALAAQDVPASLLGGLAVRRLSEHVQERIAAIERHGASPEAVRACTTLTTRVASPQFAAGLERLVRHEHGETAAVEAVRLTIEPVVQVVVELELKGVGSLGRTEVPQYFDDARRRLYLVWTSEGRMVKWVAQAVSRLLGEHALRTLAASLEHILACQPAEIDAVLNEDRIPQIASETATIAWPAAPADENPEPDELDTELDEALPTVLAGEEAAPTGDDGPALARQDRPGATAQDFAPSGPEVDAAQRPSVTILKPSRGVAGEGIVGATVQDITSSEPALDAVRLPTATSSTSHGVENGTASTDATAADTPRSHAWAPAAVSGATALATGATRVASDSLWAGASATRPPIAVRDGESRTRRDGLGGEVLHLASEDDDADEARHEVEARAIEQALRHELSQGRSAERVSESNGYDIESLDESADLRHIEVKGLAGDWRDQPVQMTPRQFEQALRLRGGYWLYVVERLSNKPRVHCIRDPARYVTRFGLDARWARFAEAAPPLTTPKPGMTLSEGDRPIARITAVKGTKPPYRVAYHASNGASVWLTFQPGKHTLKDPDDGPNDP